MSLDQLMAFTVSQDHARQLQVWEAVTRSPYRAAHEIRRMLTEGALRAGDRRVQFVGLDAYAEAGGQVLNDLFASDDGGWVQDVGLIELLATERLREEASTVGAEGWKWVDAAIDFPYGHTAGLRRLTGVGPRLSDEEQATRDAFGEELDRLYAEHEGDEDLPDAVDARLAELETAIDAFDSRPVLYDAAEVARAGAFLSIDGNGALRIDRGYVRAEDEVPVDGGDGDDGAGENDDHGRGGGPAITVGGKPEGDGAGEDDDTLKPLSERLVAELTAHRTLALRDAVALHPRVAMSMLLHKLVLDAFQRSASAGTCLEAQVRQIYFPVQGAELKDCPSAVSIAARHDEWAERIPADNAALWDWVVDQDDEVRAALLAHCVSFGVNALVEKVDRYGGSGLTQNSLARRLDGADELARAVSLDMVAAGWRPTVETYLGKVTKVRILEAVREGKGEMAAQLIGHLKKPDMAKEAERLLADSGWLPEPLRAGPDPDVAADGAEELPAFLTDGEGTGDDAGQMAVAAE